MKQEEGRSRVLAENGNDATTAVNSLVTSNLFDFEAVGKYVVACNVERRGLYQVVD